MIGRQIREDISAFLKYPATVIGRRVFIGEIAEIEEDILLSMGVILRGNTLSGGNRHLTWGNRG